MDTKAAKNPKRVAAGKKRWAGVPKEVRKSEMSELGKRGGPALWEKIRRGEFKNDHGTDHLRSKERGA